MYLLKTYLLRLTLCLIIKIIPILVTILCFSSCKNENYVNQAIITGKILNYDKEYIYINDIFGFQKEKIIPVKNGVFSDTIDIDFQHKIFELFDGNHKTKLYLSKGYDISIKYDSKNYESTFSIKGVGKEPNMYYYLKEKHTPINRLELFAKSEKAFIESLLKIEKKQKDILNKSSVSKEFKDKELKDIFYQYYSLSEEYKNTHIYYVKSEDFVRISDSFVENLKNLELNLNDQTDWYHSHYYRSLVRKSIYNKAKQIVKQDSIHINLANLNAIKNIENELIGNELLYIEADITTQLQLYNEGHYEEFLQNNLDDYYEKFLTLCTNEKYKSNIAKKYSTLKSIMKGEASPKFENFENFDGSFTSLDDLKGKYIYVDIWATWCSPCFVEFPYLNQLIEKYFNKNIYFLSISVDKQIHKKQWQKMISEKKLGGLQLLADKGFDSDFIKAYLVQGIPRYILIDPEGYIVNINAPRPSDKKLKELFDELGL